MSGTHADACVKSEGGPGSAWPRWRPCRHTGRFAAPALGYQIGLELLQRDGKLRMIAINQRHQLAPYERAAPRLRGDGCSVESRVKLVVLATRGSLASFY